MSFQSRETCRNNLRQMKTHGTPTTAPARARAAFMAARYQVDRSTIYRWVAAGILPQPIRVGPKCTLFDVAACDAALAQRSAT